MSTNKVLEIALAKLRPCGRDGKVWGAYLSNAEIISLANIGYKETKTNNHGIEWAKENLKIGKCASTWCYFDKIGDRKPKFNRVDKVEK